MYIKMSIAEKPNNEALLHARVIEQLRIRVYYVCNRRFAQCSYVFDTEFAKRLNGFASVNVV